MELCLQTICILKLKEASNISETVVKSHASIGSNANNRNGCHDWKVLCRGCCAVVTRDVEDFSIVAGNPAKYCINFRVKRNDKLYDGKAAVEKMMEKYKRSLSVIVPVYNEKKLLREICYIYK